MMYGSATQKVFIGIYIVYNIDLKVSQKKKKGGGGEVAFLLDHWSFCNQMWYVVHQHDPECYPWHLDCLPQSQGHGEESDLPNYCCPCFYFFSSFCIYIYFVLHVHGQEFFHCCETACDVTGWAHWDDQGHTGPQLCQKVHCRLLLWGKATADICHVSFIDSAHVPTSVFLMVVIQASSVQCIVNYFWVWKTEFFCLFSSFFKVFFVIMIP